MTYADWLWIDVLIVDIKNFVLSRKTVQARKTNTTLDMRKIVWYFAQMHPLAMTPYAMLPANDACLTNQLVHRPLRPTTRSWQAKDLTPEARHLHLSGAHLAR